MSSPINTPFIQCYFGFRVTVQELPFHSRNRECACIVLPVCAILLLLAQLCLLSLL